MRNPFVYGEIVPPDAFANRVVELERLVGDLAEGQKVFLISPRRYGKSSLVRQALSALARRRLATLEITVSSFSSYVAFLEGYARALLALEAKPAGAGAWIRDLFTASRPEIRLEPAPGRAAQLAVSFPAVRTPRETSRLAEEVFALPGRLAERLGRRLVIALDEFQAVVSFEGPRGAGLQPGHIEHALRAAVQQQRQVGYVFAGSEPSLMELMITMKRPFYKAGPVMRLEKIRADEFAAFVTRRFRDSGLRPDPELGEAIVDLAGNLPYDVQRLAHETWDRTVAQKKKAVSVDDLHATLHQLLDEQHTLFESLWQRLTLGQRATLRAVVLESGAEILATGTRARHRLGGASSVQTALGALIRQDLVAREGDGRYVVVDSLLREWVARRTY
jgi:hypothetical protein